MHGAASQPRASGGARRAPFPALIFAAVSPLMAPKRSREATVPRLDHVNIKALDQEAMRDFLIDVLGDIKFEDLRVPFAVVATDFRTAKPVVFREGRVAPAVAASAAIPIVFSPVKLGEMVLVDGGLFRTL